MRLPPRPLPPWLTPHSSSILRVDTPHCLPLLTGPHLSIVLTSAIPQHPFQGEVHGCLTPVLSRTKWGRKREMEQRKKKLHLQGKMLPSRQLKDPTIENASEADILGLFLFPFPEVPSLSRPRLCFCHVWYHHVLQGACLFSGFFGGQWVDSPKSFTVVMVLGSWSDNAVFPFVSL